MHSEKSPGRFGRAFPALLVLFISIFNPVSSRCASAQALFPRIEWRSVTLGNGFQLVYSENHRLPLVAVQIWYRTGSRDDPPGRRGFAHLFEHLMFKNTTNMPSEMFDRLTEDVGGENNAYTSQDVTVYHEVVPANHLERILWAEADRMRNLDVGAANLKTEREVVKEEYRSTLLSDPYGMLWPLLLKNVYRTHPYRNHTLGDLKELDRASVADVQDFYSRHYRPENAVLVVVGDFAPEKLLYDVERYFAPIERGPGPGGREVIAEPARRSPTSETEYLKGAPLAQVVVDYLAPASGHRDGPALDFATMLLAGGESSRLYRALVYEAGIAADVSADCDYGLDLGLCIVSAGVASGHSPKEVDAALRREIAKLWQSEISEGEMASIRNRLLTGRLDSLETCDGRASILGESVVFDGDAERANSYFEELLSVSPNRVRYAAKQYFREENRQTVYFLPAPGGSR